MLMNMNAQEFAVPYLEQPSYWSSTIFVVVVIGLVMGLIGGLLALRRGPEIVFLVSLIVFAASLVVFMISGLHHVFAKYDKRSAGLASSVENNYGVKVLSFAGEVESDSAIHVGSHNLTVGVNGKLYNCVQYVFETSDTYSVYCDKNVTRHVEEDSDDNDDRKVNQTPQVALESLVN